MSTASIAPVFTRLEESSLSRTKALLARAKKAGALSLNLILRWEELADRFDSWRAHRRLLGLDDSMLKDIGVPRCAVHWAARHGRDVGSAGRERTS